MSNWTQSVCDTCWHKLEGDRIPTRIKPEYRNEERCSWCGAAHWSGIYLRGDPREVPFPRIVDGDE